nr:type I restriction enzyme HsdR N-terminal domain-containing protein [Saprospiraceae bacterium]
MENEALEQDDVILDDNQLLCTLTGLVKKITNYENTLQSTILMLNEEYGFDLTDMERDFKVEYTDLETNKQKKQKVDLVVFESGKEHIQDHIIRICIVQDEKIKETDKAKGLTATLENVMAAVDSCEFGLWTNGAGIH